MSNQTADLTTRMPSLETIDEIFSISFLPVANIVIDENVTDLYSIYITY